MMTEETTELQSLLKRVAGSGGQLSKENKDSAMSLVRKGADVRVQAKSLDYKTLLHRLVGTNKEGCNDAELIELLQKDSIADIRDGYGCTALVYLIDQFQKKQCSFKDFKKTAMLLVQHGANPSFCGTVEPNLTLIHHLLMTNTNGIHDDDLNFILNKNKNAVEARAAYKNSPLTSLIDQWQTQECSWEDFKRSMLLLARHGADLTARGSKAPGKTVMHHLVSQNQDGSNNKEISELIQLNKRLMSIPDSEGNPPLHSLINPDHTSVSLIERLVVLAGVKALSCTATDGSTLLHAASSAGNLKLAEYLSGQGLDVKAKTKSANTLLHNCVAHKDALFWQWLLDNNLDLNAQNNAGLTALHLAAQQNNVLMVNWLIEHQVSLYTLDKQEKTALALAEEKRHKEVTEILLKAQNTPVGTLFNAISKVKEYGQFLQKNASPKGQVAVDLAAELWKKAETFFKQDQSKRATGFPQFKKEFSLLLNSKNKEMSQYRTSWSTIIANVAIALTGIGALLMLGQLLYSKATKGRALFFGQKPRTTTEKHLDEVSKLAENLSV